MWIRRWSRHAVKLLVSGTGFTILGMGGLLCSILVVPLLWILPGGPRKRQQRARWLISTFFRGVVKALELASVLRIDVQDLPADKELRGVLVLASHPSYIDVVVLVSLLGKAACVVKGSVWKNPFFGSTVRTAGYIPALDPECTIRDGSIALLDGQMLLLFPEGTRTKGPLPFKFQRGAAHLLLGTGAPVLPLVITCDPPFLAKGQRWYQIPESTCHYRVCARPTLSLDRIVGGREKTPTAVRRLTRALEIYFNQDVHGYDHHAAGDEAIHRGDPRPGGRPS